MMNSTEIEKGLEDNGFVMSKNNDRIHEFRKGDVVVYVKTPGKKSKSGIVATRPLIIHPDYKESRYELDDLNGIEINWAEHRINSSMQQFPKMPDPKNKRRHYGHDVNVSDDSALRKLIGVLQIQDDKDVDELLEPLSSPNHKSEQAALQLTSPSKNNSFDGATKTPEILQASPPVQDTKDIGQNSIETPDILQPKQEQHLLNQEKSGSVSPVLLISAMVVLVLVVMTMIWMP